MYQVQCICGHTEDMPWYVGRVEGYDLCESQNLRKCHNIVYAKVKIICSSKGTCTEYSASVAMLTICLCKSVELNLSGVKLML